jgi:hypothetical protein
MNKFDKPAAPYRFEYPDRTYDQYPGLTIRQQAVLMMAQGLLASGASTADIGDAAIRAADMVLKREAETR